MSSLDDLRGSDKYGGHKPFETVEQFLAVRSSFRTEEETSRSQQLRRLFLDLLKEPAFHLMTTAEKAEAVGIDEMNVKRWYMQVPEAYLAEALKTMRERSARQSLAVDAALLREATVEGGDAKHKELFYRRIENWNPSQNVELTRGRDKDLEGKANFELLKQLVGGLSEEQRAELLGFSGSGVREEGKGVDGGIPGSSERLDMGLEGGGAEGE